jgi:3-oxoacyl-[acyl-carrier protein] reductase
MASTQRVAIVTGAAKGIGRAIALRLAQDDVDIVIADVDLVGAKKVAKEVQQVGQQAIAVKVDISKLAQVKNMVETALKEWGRIDILVNNASICYDRDVPDITEEEWDRVIEINLKGTFLCCQAVFNLMKEQGYGRIINISSNAGQAGAVLAGAHYAASKAGQLNLTKTLAKKLAPYGVTVNSVAPSSIKTDMLFSSFAQEQLESLPIPVGRLGEPEEVAEVVAFLASEKAGFITGATYNVNGGMYMD